MWIMVEICPKTHGHNYFRRSYYDGHHFLMLITYMNDINKKMGDKLLKVLCPEEKMCFGCHIYTVRPVSNSHSKIDKTEILLTNDSLMKVKSIAECSPWTCIKQ